MADNQEWNFKLFFVGLLLHFEQFSSLQKQVKMNKHSRNVSIILPHSLAICFQVCLIGYSDLVTSNLVLNCLWLLRAVNLSCSGDAVWNKTSAVCSKLFLLYNITHCNLQLGLLGPESTHYQSNQNADISSILLLTCN